jgi:hypothetical protein
MMNRRYCLLLALPFALAACAGDDDAEVDTMAGDTTMAPTAGMPADTGMGSAMGGMMVTLSAVGESGVGGNATLGSTGGVTEVMVRLTGLEPGSTHPGHIHQGTCDAIGSVAAPLMDITADNSGAGTMNTTVPLSMDSILASPHLISYHGDGGAPIACGEIKHEM